MENEKIVEEKKPKKRINVIGIIFIIIGIAMSGIFIELYNAIKPTPQTGSQYVGVYKCVSEEEDYDGHTIELCEDGFLKYDGGFKDLWASWQETENGFTLYPGTGDALRYVETSANCYRQVFEDGIPYPYEHYEKQ